MDDNNKNQFPRSERNSLQSSMPATEQQISARIIALMVSHGTANAKTEGEKRALVRTYCEDLKGETDARLAYAIARWRRENTGFVRLPTSAEILERCDSPYADKGKRRSEGRIVDGEWMPWGGACECERCKAQRHAMGYEREQIRPASKLDGHEMYTRRILVDELVRAGMTSEDARVRVMRERTALLYPDNPFAQRGHFT